MILKCGNTQNILKFHGKKFKNQSYSQKIPQQNYKILK